ncbi:EamA family transporter [Risungbinella massiliensis]|uniref:EamA family transporter n=1 Tax=Risungbinella massiliensis TaxID=1329796 RepID=UPI0005CBCC9D|nr:EamA family transporter [Risungbinella massiliensis]
MERVVRVPRWTGKIYGYLLVLTAATFWGVSGTVVQKLFASYSFTAEWLVVTRLLISGVILIVYGICTKAKETWAIWTTKDRIALIIFGIVGLLGVQYTFFAAIAHSNAATATLLQYLGPVLIVFYFSFLHRKLPTHLEWIAIAFALIGSFFLITGGNWNQLSITPKALFWGIASAFGLAFYTVQPVSLLRCWGSITIVGWGMLIGGIGLAILQPPWNVVGIWTGKSIFFYLFVILFGTLIPFLLYLESLNHIQASETSLISCAEPLSAAIVAVIWLHVPFGIMEWIGATFIMGTILILAIQKEKETSTKIE